MRRPLPVDAAVLDTDGAVLDVRVHTDVNGRLMELEVLRVDDGPIAGPDWTTLRRRRPGESVRLNQADSPLEVWSLIPEACCLLLP